VPVLHGEAAVQQFGQQTMRGGLGDAQMRGRLAQGQLLALSEQYQQAQGVID
jgi:hypothetical protein